MSVSSIDRLRAETAEARPLVAAKVAPAKINLALHVTGRRADGYHLLDSLVCFAADGDGLRVCAAEQDGLELSGPFAAEVPVGGGNMVLRALDLARARLPVGERVPSGVSIRLDKRLPVASGIGGGSSDAAALLRILSEHAPGLRGELARASLALGADVPMCVERRPCRVTGIGELIEPVVRFPACALLLVNPGRPVSTPDVFRALANRKNAALPPIPAGGFLAVEDLVAYLGATRNDLEAAALALAPPIGEAREALVANGASFARMSGSGATVFGLFADSASARGAAAAISRAHPAWWVLETRTRPTRSETP